MRDELAALTASAAGEAHRLNRGLTILQIVMLGLASLLGISVSITVSNRMMAGLERLIQGTRQVQDGQGYEMLPVTSNDEIGKLTVAFNHMVEDLRAKDRIKETFASLSIRASSPTYSIQRVARTWPSGRSRRCSFPISKDSAAWASC